MSCAPTAPLLRNTDRAHERRELVFHEKGNRPREKIVRDPAGFRTEDVWDRYRRGDPGGAAPNERGSAFQTKGRDSSRPLNERSRTDAFRRVFAAQYRIFHGEVLPSSITPRCKYIAGLQVID